MDLFQKIEKNMQISPLGKHAKEAHGYFTYPKLEGEISSGSNARVIRDGTIIYTGKISTIFREKNQAKQVSNGQECGITLKDFIDFQKNDTIEAFKTVSTERMV